MTDRLIVFALVASGALAALVCIVSAGSRRVSSRASSALKLGGVVVGFACVLAGVIWTYGGSVKRVGLFVAGCAAFAVVLSRVSALLLKKASKAPDGASEIIYIRLLNEGVDAWAQAPARRLTGTVFEVLPPSDYNPKAEKWEFVPGTTVQCEKRVRGSQQILVAVRRASGSGGPIGPKR